MKKVTTYFALLTCLLVSMAGTTPNTSDDSKAEMAYGEVQTGTVCPGIQDAFVKNNTSSQIVASVLIKGRGFNDCNKYVDTTKEITVAANGKTFVGQTKTNCARSVNSVECRTITYHITKVK